MEDNLFFLNFTIDFLLCYSEKSKIILAVKLLFFCKLKK